MPVIQNELSGQTFNLPDDSTPEQQAEMLRQLLQVRPLGIPGSPEMRELGEAVRKTRRERTAATAEQQLGGPLERTETGRLAEFDRPGTRFDLARSNLISEKVAKLQEKFPDFEINEFNDPEGRQQIAVRAPDSEEFTLLDSSEFTSLSDAADIAGLIATPETLTAVAAAVATQGRSLFTRIGAQILGGTLGRALDIGIETARGFQDDPLEDVFADIALSGIAAGTGELVAAPLRRGARAVVGQGAIELSPAEQAAVGTMREAGVRGPSLGQVQPLAQRMEQQAAATSKRVQEFRLGQMEDALKDIKRIQTEVGDVGGLTDQELVNVSNQIKDDLFDMITSPNVSPERAGRALKQGRKEFTRIWKGLVGRRYDRALSAGEDASFDLAPTQTIGKDLRRGVRAKGLPKETELVAPNGTPILDAGGTPLKVTKETSVQLRQLNSELNTVVDDILKIDPDIKAFEGNTAFEQIKALRTRLFDLKNATVDGQETIQNRMAGQLWDSLSQVMDNPRGGTDQFRLFMRSAAEANKRFERILEVESIAEIARTKEMGGLVRSIARPGKAFSLRILKRILPEPQFETFRSGFMSDLVSEPETILKRLDAFRRDPQALRSLLSDGEEAMLRLLGTRFERFNQSALQKALKDQTSLPQKVKSLVSSGGDAELADIVKAGGGKNSKIGKALRAGLVRSILDAGEVVQKGRKVLNPAKAMAKIRQLEKNGVLAAVMQPDEVKTLQNREFMLSILPVQADTGALIRAGELASDVAEIATVPIQGKKAFFRFLSGITGVLRNALVGKVFISDRARRLFVGMGDRQMDFTALRAISAISAEVAASIERDQLGKKKKP